MKLKISVIKYKGIIPTDKQDFIFGKEGGNIGRDKYCTWCLPDKKKYISKRHLSILFENEKFHLIDRGLNGCFINQSNQPIEKGIHYELKDNDIIYMGEYELQVYYINPLNESNNEIDWVRDFPDVDTLKVKNSGIDVIDKEKNKNVTENATDSENIKTMINESSSQEKIPTLVNNKINIKKQDKLSNTDVFKRKNSLDDSQTKIIKTNPPLEESKEEIPMQLDEKSIVVLNKIFKAAGINTEKTIIKPTEETAVIIGEALNEMLQGIMSLLQSRAEIKQSLHVSDNTLIQYKDNNPLKFLPSAEHVINQLIVLEGSDQQMDNTYLPLIKAIRESFNDLKSHQLAITMSIQDALSSTIQDYFSPKNLQKKLEKSNLITNQLPWKKKSQLWELFESTYKEIEEEAAEKFQIILERKIANAYELNIKEIKNNE